MTDIFVNAGSEEPSYSLNGDTQEILGKGGTFMISDTFMIGRPT